jgi:modification methylase
MATSDPTVPKKRVRKKTQTKTFGASRRENHDAQAFYQSRLYEGRQTQPLQNGAENRMPDEVINRLYCQSSETMAQLPDASVHLMITSPPYNASKQYDDDLSLAEYRAFLKQVFREVYRVLVTGGRICINVANLGRSPYIPLHAFIIQDMLDIGFLMRGEIIWDKGTSAGISTAWGSWKSPSNPTLRDTHEYILVFSKGSFSRQKPGPSATISKEEFVALTKSLWQFRSVSARKIGHPAPFPEELPYRLIQLYSFENDVILDPFCGSGTTCAVAARTGRRYVGYDNNPDYIALAAERLQAQEMLQPQ